MFCLMITLHLCYTTQYTYILYQQFKQDLAVRLEASAGIEEKRICIFSEMSMRHFLKEVALVLLHPHVNGLKFQNFSLERNLLWLWAKQISISQVFICTSESTLRSQLQTISTLKHLIFTFECSKQAFTSALLSFIFLNHCASFSRRIRPYWLVDNCEFNAM